MNMQNNDSQAKRINELEEKLTYLQADYDALNETVLENTKRLDQFRQMLERLTSRVDNVADNHASSDLADEKPPHY